MRPSSSETGAAPASGPIRPMAGSGRLGGGFDEVERHLLVQGARRASPARPRRSGRGGRPSPAASLGDVARAGPSRRPWGSRPSSRRTCRSPACGSAARIPADPARARLGEGVGHRVGAILRDEDDQLVLPRLGGRPRLSGARSVEIPSVSARTSLVPPRRRRARCGASTARCRRGSPRRWGSARPRASRPRRGADGRRRRDRSRDRAPPGRPRACNRWRGAPPTRAAPGRPRAGRRCPRTPRTGAARSTRALNGRLGGGS